MELPLTPFYGAIAVLPIAFLLTAIMKFGWGVAKAAPIGMVLAFMTAAMFFRSSFFALTMEAGKGIWNAATILLVIWPAVFSYEILRETQGFQAIRNGIQNLTRHKLLQILIFGWVFPSFLQGITGFGVAVAVGAPLLMSIGVAPFYSIIIVLLCHCWGTTFGTLALAWEALSASGLDAEYVPEAALLAAGMLWIFQSVGVVFSCWIYGKGKALKEVFPVVVVVLLIMGGGELFLAPLNASIACFLPSVCGLFAILLFSRTKKYQKEWEIRDSKIMNQACVDDDNMPKMGFHAAFLPYYSLTLITVVCLLVPPVNKVLGKWKIGFAFPQTITGYGFVTEAESCFSPQKPLTYAGTFLVVSAVITLIYYRHRAYIRRDGIKAVWQRTISKCLPPTIAISCFIIMSKFMSSSGQIYVLSQGIIALLGHYYIAAAPFFGMLGAFLTSSNMSSNILLGDFQITAAKMLGINPAITAALQTVGGSLGNCFAPGCVVMGISTTGCIGADGKILKTIIPITMSCAVVFGIVSYFVYT